MIGKDKFSKTYKFSDINYAVASREDKETMLTRADGQTQGDLIKTFRFKE